MPVIPTIAAIVPLNAMLAVVKPLPSISMISPTLPDNGLTAVILGGISTEKKLTKSLATPVAVVTEKKPDVAPAGIRT